MEIMHSSHQTPVSLQLLISVTNNTISASGVWKDVIQSVIIQPLLDPLVSRKID